MCSTSGVSASAEKSMATTKDDDAEMQGCCSPARATFRYTGCILICLTIFGSVFCYDNPGALEDYFLNNLNMSTEEFVLLYSMYSWPNIISCFLGGFLIDRIFGIRWGTLIYVTLALVGHVIFAAAAYVNAFWLMMVGRFVFGIGGESLSVALDNYMVLWFKGNELNTVFGLQLSVAHIASMVNFLIMENLYSYVSDTLNFDAPHRIGVTLFFTALTCVASVISALVLSVMDIKAERFLRRNECVKANKMKFRDVKDFRNIFWLIALISITYFTTIYPFLALAKVYFMTKYELPQASANNVTGMVYVIATVACPIVGILIDKTGKNIWWMIAGIAGTLLAHVILAFTYVTPYLSMVIIGIAFSLFETSFWTQIALVIPEHQLGTAFGIVGSLLNLGLAVAPMFCGIIVDTHGYFMLEVFFIALLLISLITAVVLRLLDKSSTTIYSVTG